MPVAPKGLGSAGKVLWKAILSDLREGWELDRRELHFLERACRVEDEMRQLEKVVDQEGPTTRGSTGQLVVHPGVLESRQLKVAQLRLLSALELEDPDERSPRATPASKRARRAAQSRYGRRKQGA
jgi:P27 family predicted phage terminase small subunit